MGVDDRCPEDRVFRCRDEDRADEIAALLGNDVVGFTGDGSWAENATKAEVLKHHARTNGGRPALAVVE